MRSGFNIRGSLHAMSAVWLALVLGVTANAQDTVPDPAPRNPPEPTAELDPDAAQEVGEADDQRAFARAAALFTDFEVSISSETDQDWYRVVLFRQGILTLTQKQARSDQLELALFDPEDQPVALVDPVWKGDDLVYSLPGALPGAYYIRLGGPARPAPYIMALDLTAQSDNSEPNDTPKTARPAKGSYTINRHSDTDQDWFALKLDEPSLFRIVIGPQGAERGAFTAEITSAETGQTINPPFFASHDKDGAVIQMLMTHLIEGDYNIRLTAPHVGQSSGPVRFETLIITDPFEPNNSAEMARPWGLGETIRAVELFPGDADWFFVDLEMPGELIVELISEVAPEISIYADQDRETALPLKPNAGQPGYSLDAPAGRYFIKATLPGNTTGRVDARLAFIPRPAGNNDTLFFMIGLDTSDSTLDQLTSIAKEGQGEVLAVAANDLDLALSLGSVVAQTQKRRLGIGHLVRTSFKIMQEKAFRIYDTVFTPTLAGTKISATIKSGIQDQNTSREAFTPAFLARQVGIVREKTQKQADEPASNDRLRRMLRAPILSRFQSK